jgi:hypothetical protein
MSSQDDPVEEGSVRSLIAKATGADHVGFSSLAEAQENVDAVAILEGDSGGQIYVVARANIIRCNEKAIRQLLIDLDAIEWSAPEMHLSTMKL